MHDLPGIQVAVFAEDRIVLSSAHGLADAERGTALGTEDLFRIASHSKTFTATAVMQLVEERRLDLDERIDRRLDYVGGSELGRASVRELLSHTSGVFENGPAADFWQGCGDFPDRDGLRSMFEAPGVALIAPGSHYKYSNVGYALLGEIVEAVAGLGFDEYVGTKIIGSLGLAHTGPDLSPARRSHYVAGHTSRRHTDRRTTVEQQPARAMAPAAGFYSNADDLVTFLSAHFDGDPRLLSDRSKQLMQDPVSLRSDSSERPDEAYGLGLEVDRIGGRRLVGHTGTWAGQQTRSAADPTAGLAISVLTNAMDGPAESLVSAGFRLIDLAGAGESDPQLQRFTGRFANLWGVIDVVLLGRRLYRLFPAADDPTRDVAPLAVVDECTLRYEGGAHLGELMTYRFGPDGAIVSVRGDIAMTSVPLDDYTRP